ncbi:hypothetical protein U9M48_032076 [Paspalum notatum var. saurae]|uniref:Uncharacterized protein n=1 Tax=Paspalum notatum var. saurae TaxID=547442 RepID=A0AAQ3X435_PASNO
MCMYDPANEELPQEQPLIEEPEDEQEDWQPAADHLAKETPLTRVEKGPEGDGASSLSLHLGADGARGG